MSIRLNILDKHQENFDTTLEILKASTVDFPLEKDKLKSYSPSILLNMPEIKSNETLIQHVNILIGLRDKILAIQENIEEKKAFLLWHKYFGNWVYFRICPTDIIKD
jgi:hypothetical protein